MNYLEKLIGDIEVHSEEGIRECFSNGISPNDIYNNRPLIDELTSEYLRSPRFSACVQAFVDHGLLFGEPDLLSVLLDDAVSLEKSLATGTGGVDKRYTLRCAFTPLQDVTLLHICAEFNQVRCARVLLAHGADVNARAGVDSNGFGGQTPLFHTVNQIRNHSLGMLHLLLEASADVQVGIRGLIWGKGYEWETFIPSVNPLSYAMMGLLPQMHRRDTDISGVVSLLLKAAHGLDYELPNIHNKYLQG